jgi:hypothetical protein
MHPIIRPVDDAYLKQTRAWILLRFSPSRLDPSLMAHANYILKC